MSRHDRFRQMLARRAELTPGEETRLQRHLQTCPDCRETAAVYARQSAVLRSLKQSEPPPALRAWVLTSIHQPSRPRPSAATPLRRRLSFLAPMAAAFLLLFGAFAYLEGPHHPVRTAVGKSTPIPLSSPRPSLPSPHLQQPRARPRPPAPAQRRSTVPRSKPSGLRPRSNHGVKAPSSPPAPQYVASPTPVTAPPIEQPVAAPVVVSQQVAKPLPPVVRVRVARAARPKPASVAAARLPAPIPTQPPATSGIPGAQPVTGPPAEAAASKPGGVGVDKVPPEALAYVPPPAPPPPPPPTAATPPSANSISVPATPGPTSEVQAGPNPVLVPVTPTTPIP